MTPGERLKRVRLRRGITQDELGKRINRSTSQITRYENGITAIPNNDTARALSEALQVSLAYLFGFSDVMQDKVVSIPIINSIINGDLIVTDYQEKTTEDLSESKFFYTIARDNSMFPYITNNSLVLFEHTEKASNQDVVCILPKGDVYPVIRQLRIEDGITLFVPFKINEKIYLNKANNNIKIFGRFVESTHRKN